PVDAGGEWGRAVGLSEASNSMGGDLIDVVDHGASADVILADVSGHGVRAGVVMAMLKTAFRGAATGDRSPGDVAAAVNEAMVALTAEDVFATAWLLRMTTDGCVECVGCGHPPVFRIGRDGATSQIASESMPLGVVGETDFESCRIELGPGERLVLFSDGLTEARFPNGEMIGIEGLERLIRGIGTEEVATLPRRVLLAVTTSSTTDDDQSVLVATGAASEPDASA
ncbi:MAG: PP2C family protein-serine/threonine phosphatase, partial [Planctomycetota bacterium]